MSDSSSVSGDSENSRVESFDEYYDDEGDMDEYGIRPYQFEPEQLCSEEDSTSNSVSNASNGSEEDEEVNNRLIDSSW